MENRDISVIENSLDILKTGPSILLANQARVSKAIAVGENILTLINEQGMSPELDQRANTYMVNIGKASKEIKEDRAGVTQIMDELKKMFTAEEAKIDPKKADTVPFKIQAARDQYAKEQAEAERKRREAAEREAEKSRESINLKFTVENRLANYFNDHLLKMKQRLQESFNGITLADFDEKSEALKNYVPLYSDKHYREFSAGIYSKLHTPEELDSIVKSVTSSKQPEFTAIYGAEMIQLRQELVDRLPSKKAELEEQKRIAEEAERQRQEELKRQQEAEEKRKQDLEKAAAADKERLEREAEEARQKEAERLAELERKAEQEKKEAEERQRQREAEEADRLQREAEEAKAKAAQEAEIRKQGEQTMVLFEQEAAIADGTPAPEVRQGYDLVVLHPAGFVQIFQLWFENEGKNLGIDKIGNTKMDQMKAWAEKHAHKNNVKIESKFLRYDESFKAVNRKAK